MWEGLGLHSHTFLAMTASNFMSAECRREWLRHRPPDTPPDMNNLSRFIDVQKKELRGASTLTSGLPASSHLPTPSARPSSPRVDRSRTMPVKVPPPGDPHSIALCAEISTPSPGAPHSQPIISNEETRS